MCEGGCLARCVIWGAMCVRVWTVESCVVWSGRDTFELCRAVRARAVFYVVGDLAPKRNMDA